MDNKISLDVFEKAPIPQAVSGYGGHADGADL